MHSNRQNKWVRAPESWHLTPPKIRAAFPLLWECGGSATAFEQHKSSAARTPRAANAPRHCPAALRAKKCAGTVIPSPARDLLFTIGLRVHSRSRSSRQESPRQNIAANTEGRNLNHHSRAVSSGHAFSRFNPTSPRGGVSTPPKNVGAQRPPLGGLFAEPSLHPATAALRARKCGGVVIPSHARDLLFTMGNARSLAKSIVPRKNRRGRTWQPTAHAPTQGGISSSAPVRFRQCTPSAAPISLHRGAGFQPRQKTSARSAHRSAAFSPSLPRFAGSGFRQGTVSTVPTTSARSAYRSAAFSPSLPKIHRPVPNFQFQFSAAARGLLFFAAAEERRNGFGLLPHDSAHVRRYIRVVRRPGHPQRHSGLAPARPVQRRQQPHSHFSDPAHRRTRHHQIEIQLVRGRYRAASAEFSH